MQNEHFLILVIVVLVFLGIGFSVFNTIEVCKTHDIYWVSGTQYSCSWFKK